MVFVHFLFTTQVILTNDLLDDPTCDFFITQADIDGNDGGFNITQPGNWCLAENIVTTKPISITNLPGLVFDLNGKNINSLVKGDAAILDIKACQNITIKNGTITGSNQMGPVPTRWAIRFTDSPDYLVNNIPAIFLGSTPNSPIQQYFIIYTP